MEASGRAVRCIRDLAHAHHADGGLAVQWKDVTAQRRAEEASRKSWRLAVALLVPVGLLAVVGLGAMTGGIGGMFMTLLVALVVQWTGNQQMVFNGLRGRVVKVHFSLLRPAVQRRQGLDDGAFSGIQSLALSGALGQRQLDHHRML